MIESCPMCDNPAKIFRAGKLWLVTCTSCGLQLAHRKREAVIRLWNTRVNATYTEILTKLEETLKCLRELQELQKIQNMGADLGLGKANSIG